MTRNITPADIKSALMQWRRVRLELKAQGIREQAPVPEFAYVHGMIKDLEKAHWKLSASSI